MPINNQKKVMLQWLRNSIKSSEQIEKLFINKLKK